MTSRVSIILGFTEWLIIIVVKLSMLLWFYKTVCYYCGLTPPHESLTCLFVSQGMDSGFAGGEDENYTVYDKPWRQDRDIATSIYRPSKNIDKDQYGDDLDKLIRSNRLVTCLHVVCR